MRQLFLLLLLSSTAFGQTALQKFSITVKGSHLPKGKYLYISYFYSDSDSFEKIDSQVISSDQVIFKGGIWQPAPARIYFEFPSEILPSDLIKQMSGVFENGRFEIQFDFFLMPGATHIVLDKLDGKRIVAGPTAVLDFQELKIAKVSYDEREFDIMEKILLCRAGGDSECENQLTNDYNNLNERIRNEVYLDYYLKHINSSLALYALKSSVSSNRDSIDVYLKRLSRLPKKERAFPEAILFKKFLQAVPNSYPGKYVRDFEQLDTSGNRVAFNSFAGRYVLIDFWKSSPLMRNVSNPDLLVLWSKYGQKKFSIISIALESNATRNEWLRIIRKNMMPWTHLTDFKGSFNTAAQQFGVLSLPFNLLVDPSGKIALRNVQLKEIDHFLDSVLE
jgi:hypothetical protein